LKYTDSHCHLDFDELPTNAVNLIQQCADADIHQIIVPSIAPNNWQKVLSLPEKHNRDNCKIYCCLGIHPWFLNDLNSAHLTALSSTVATNRNKLIAIGEAGIDIVIAKQQDNLTKQTLFFQHQVELAKEVYLPIIVHHRRSHQYILPILNKEKPERSGIIHAFSGSYQQAKHYVDLGFKLGIGGTITYPRAEKTIKAVKKLPLESLVLETDAPAMPLHGFQGEANSPLQLLNVFKALVAIREESAETIATQLEHNIQSLFRLS